MFKKTPSIHPTRKVTQAREKLLRLLQQAHAGEKAAAFAYHGHAASWWARNERSEINQIEAEEWAHRAEVRRMIQTLGGMPSPALESRMAFIGKSIAYLCHLGGWLIPMYGAGALERMNVWEYETAARLACEAGEVHFCNALLAMAEVEWDHERYFRGQVKKHPVGRFLPLWPDLPPRESIRERFQQFCRRYSGTASLSP